MRELTIDIRPDGSVEMLAVDMASPFVSMGEGVRKRRASHITPTCLKLKLWFKLLRWVFGDSGRVGEWTRRWVCAWTVDLRPSGGPVIDGFMSRRKAIDFEHRWLMEEKR